MYHSFFGLQKEPFGVTADPAFFFATDQHREASATLYYAVEQRRGIATLIAHPGLGKTLVVNHLLTNLRGRADIARFSYPHLDVLTILPSVLAALEIDPFTARPHDAPTFHRYLLDLHRRGKTCVVIIDEAQQLSRDVLESVRLLSSFELATDKLVQIILVGQASLADTLNQSDCQQIQQRIGASAHLKPLTQAQTFSYVAHRLQVAGASKKLFTDQALQAIVDFSGGVPRKVNAVCFNALTLAYALGQRQVTTELVNEALNDLDLFVPSDTPDISFPPDAERSANNRFRQLGRTTAVATFAVGAALLLKQLVSGYWQ